MKKGDARKLVTTFYHPHAVSVRRGAGASYGHDGTLRLCYVWY